MKNSNNKNNNNFANININDNNIKPVRMERKIITLNVTFRITRLPKIIRIKIILEIESKIDN